MTCTICKHTDLEKVNQLLVQEVSLRNIAKQILGDEKHYQAIYRHAGQCLNYDLKLAVQNKRIESVVNPYDELKGQLEFAKKLRLAAQNYLSHPDTGEICLFPRSDEVYVIYDDYSDVKKDGEPKKKTDTLDVLIEKFVTKSLESRRTFIKHVDIRQFALNSISTADTVIDKFARIEGLYAQDKQNPNDLARIADEDARTLQLVSDIVMSAVKAIESGEVKASEFTPESVKQAAFSNYLMRTDRMDEGKELVRRKLLGS